MNILNNNEINILDLPDEMLLSIFNKLNNVDVLYSLVDVNQRFDRLVLYSLVIHDLDFTINSLLDCDFKEYSERFGQICTSILPRIHHQINKLTLGQLSIERVLYTLKFPQLHSLSLVSVEFNRLLAYIIGMLYNIFRFNQVNFLIIFCCIFKVIQYFIVFFAIKLCILISMLNWTTLKSLNLNYMCLD
jgi:hypothetical protein